MSKFKKHHNEDLGGTKGRWRPALIAGSVVGADGHPLSHEEIAIFTCPTCGAPQGVGGDNVKIKADGTTDGPVKCYNCPWIADVMTFEKHADAEGREHYSRLKTEAMDAIAETRIRVVKETVRQNMMKELDEKVHAEAKRILPDGDPNHRELFKNFMKNGK